MNKVVLASAFLLFQLSLLAQKEKKPMPGSINIPLVAEKWGFPPGTCTFLSYKSVPSMRLLTNKDTAVFKDLRFSSGTIEYDIEPEDKDFTGFYFRRQDNMESEYF